MEIQSPHPVQMFSSIVTLSSRNMAGQPNSLMHAMQFVHLSVIFARTILMPMRLFSLRSISVHGDLKTTTEGPDCCKASFSTAVASFVLNGSTTLTYLTPQPSATFSRRFLSKKRILFYYCSPLAHMDSLWRVDHGYTHSTLSIPL